MPIIEQFENELYKRSESAFGRWYAVDLHNHSPASHDFRGNRETAVDDAVQHLQQKSVDIVMFTDHGKLPDRHFTEEVARRSNKTILRGAELNIFVDVWDKPEDKIEKNLFFHLLVGFDPEANQRPRIIGLLTYAESVPMRSVIWVVIMCKGLYCLQLTPYAIP